MDSSLRGSVTTVSVRRTRFAEIARVDSVRHGLRAVRVRCRGTRCVDKWRQNQVSTVSVVEVPGV